MGVGLLVGVWVARYLGPEQFGLLSFATAFTGLFGAIAALGLQSIVVRDIVRDPDTAKVTLGTAAMLQFVGGLVAYLLILGAIAYMRPDDALARTIVAILGSMMLLKASDIAIYWFESQVQSKYVVWVQNGTFLSFAAIKVLLILNHASLISFVWAMLAEAIIVAILLLAVMSKRGPTPSALSLTIARAGALLKDSWPLILAGLAITVYMKIDQIMLGQMIGDQAVGIYSAATRISEVWYFIPMSIVASTFPTILESKKFNEPLYEIRLISLLRLLISISILVSIIFTLLSEYVIDTLFGYAYQESANVLIIHIWTGIFVSIGLVSGKWFLAENKTVYVLRITVLGAILNALLNLLLIPPLGTLGAALSTLVSYAVSNVLWLAIFAETRPLFQLVISSIFVTNKYEKK